MADTYDPFEGMSPIDRLKMRMSLANQALVSPEQRSANLRQTGEEALGVLPVIGNAMAARDAYNAAGDAYSALSKGDYKAGGLNALMGAISGVGVVTGLPVGKAAGRIAKSAPHTAHSVVAPVARTADHDRAGISGSRARTEGSQTMSPITLRHDGFYDGARNYERMAIFDGDTRIGSVVGRLDPENPKQFNIEQISSPSGPSGVGPARIRAVIGALRERYPDIETVGGLRWTGARQGSPEMVKVNVGGRQPTQTRRSAGK